MRAGEACRDQSSSAFLKASSAFDICRALHSLCGRRWLSCVLNLEQDPGTLGWLATPGYTYANPA